MNLRKCILLIIIFLFACNTIANASEETPNDRIMFVLDSSGSMWGQIDDLSKYKIAKDALNKILPELADTSELGLIAYGHRRKSDCTDIELISPLSENNGSNISTAISELRPAGKTPLSAAVQQAAELFSNSTGKATVILITDGIETCDADPCALGAELKQQNIDFTAHVIGFGLSDSEGHQVACLAEETGGLYLKAENASALSESLQNVADTVKEEPEPVTETAEATLEAPASAEIGTNFEVQWQGPSGEQDYIDLVASGHEPTSEGTLSSTVVSEGNPVILRAAKSPGTYDIRYVWVNHQGRQVIARTSIEIKDVEVALIAPEQVGIGQVFAVDWKGPNNEKDYIDLVDANFSGTSRSLSNTPTKKGSPAILQAPAEAGTYSIRYVFNGPDGKRVIKTTSIKVEPVRTEVAFNPQAKQGEKISVNWTGPGNERDYIDIVPHGQTKTSKNISSTSLSKGNPLELKLPKQAGEYDVRYILRTPRGKEVLVVAPLTVE